MRYSVNDIIQGNRIEFDVDEMKWLVERYVSDRKGQTVNIDVITPCIDYTIRNNFNVLLYKLQIDKLIKAFNIAYGYYKTERKE